LHDALLCDQRGGLHVAVRGGCGRGARGGGGPWEAQVAFRGSGAGWKRGGGVSLFPFRCLSGGVKGATAGALLPPRPPPLCGGVVVWVAQFAVIAIFVVVIWGAVNVLGLTGWRA